MEVMISEWHHVNYRMKKKDKLDSQVIATDGIAVIVNKNNTTDELSSDQGKDNLHW